MISFKINLVSVKDRLPEENESDKYLVLIDHMGFVTTASVTELMVQEYCITHWAPLPVIYTADEKED